ERREVPAGTGRDPAAERADLERLREVPQRQSVRPELVLERRPEHAGLDARRPRRAIDLEDAIEPAEVDAEDAPTARVGRRLHAAHDARPAAVRDRDQVALAAPVEEPDDVVL